MQVVDRVPEVHAPMLRVRQTWLRELAYIVSEVNREVQPQSLADPPAVTTPNRAPRDSMTTVATETTPWSCIAAAETGTNWHMVGSTYSTAFGMVNDIIRQYGTPQEQADVFSGTASPSEQVDIASRFAAQNGFGGWGVLTREKCNL